MKKIIFLDFDGTVVEHRYPLMGKPVPHAVRVLHRLMMKEEILIVLNTMRVEIQPLDLNDVYVYFKQNDIRIDNRTSTKVNPKWNPPFGTNIFIDDIAGGIPLVPDTGGLWMVDWLGVEKILEECNIL